MWNVRVFSAVAIVSIILSMGCDPKDTSTRTVSKPSDGGGETAVPRPRRPRQPRLFLANDIVYPTRMCARPDGTYLVSDAKVGSVFILDRDLKPTGEFKRCGKPLGVAVDERGRVYVGDNTRDGILVFNPQGRLMTIWGRGKVKMPNDMVFHHDGRLFVVDSKCNDVKIFSPKGRLLTSLGHPVEGWDGFDFPNSIVMGPVRIENSEDLGCHVYVSDFMNARIAVFTDKGEFVKVLDGTPTVSPTLVRVAYMGGFGRGPKFSKIQSMEFDAEGVLHVLDCYQHKISKLDVELDQVLSTYGTYGTGVGQLSLPLDLTIDPTGGAIVTNANTSRVDRVVP